MSGKHLTHDNDQPAPYGDPDTVHSIYRECIEETKPVPTRERTFLAPRLKGIHHLDIGYSKVVTASPGMILDNLYNFYDGVKDTLHEWWLRLCPRPTAITGTDFRGSSIVGRTTYAGRHDHDKPIHHLRVELWGRTWWLGWRRLAEGYSGFDGRFELPYDLRAARSSAIRKIRAEISQTTYRFDRHGNRSRSFSLAVALPIKKSDLVGMRYDLRDIQIELWCYRPDCYIPRVKIDDLQHEAPEKYVEGRNEAITDQFIPVELIKLKHVTMLRADPNALTIEEIQADYPPNLTTCIEARLPGYSRSDEFFGERMMNGMNALTFEPIDGEEHRYRVVNWGYQGYDHNNVYAFPTTEMDFEILPGDHAPRPLQITITGALSAFEHDPDQKRTFYPTDGERWLQAKRVARSVGGLISEVDDHFARTHVNVEQYAIAANRNLRLNPVTWLLLPHLKEVSLIDHTADRMLISQEAGYIPRASALTEKGLKHRVRDALGMMNWKGYRPMPVINDHHYYARAENLFWDITYEYISEFFEHNAADIRAYWYEIFAMSEDLVSHSVPAFDREAHLRGLEGRAYEVASRRLNYWTTRFDHQPQMPTGSYGGEPRALSPITQAKDFAQADPDDWENLKEMCCYAIHHATFLHSWVNEHQHDDIGEVLYSCLGLRFGEHPDGVMHPESDHRIAPDPLRATQMLWWSNLLSRTEYGAITKNPDGDVNPRFGELLKAHEAEFRSYGVLVDNIESRTNI
ncbi:hypothetical protein GGR26_003165 [Lewinella marina]|uniref:Lipoxygenase domain-containing protein n=1 Tax=Neolewinella marina TaxID=438751 RepID=A0A2G0CEA2_9BACT|nr:lipoxygenase family protein [Neolewinella marina]NJB87385.1 hypothetical protein [Neolewinella marina]PHK98303.1 hypothetical protein CGL56_11415 [Neolewinella marina]